MTVTAEYGLRATLPGRETVEESYGADHALRDQRVVDLLDLGARDVAPLIRSLASWVVDEAAEARIKRDRDRAAVLAIAQQYWEADEDESSLAKALADLHPYAPKLRDDRREQLLEALISELTYQEEVDNDEVAPGPGEDKQSLAEAAEQRVHAAVESLIGGGPE